jgi:phage terminase small subunit
LSRTKQGREHDQDLTAKQRLFVRAYLENGQNAAEAARAAGYSASSAKQVGAENLTKPTVRRAIQAGLAAVEAKVRESSALTLERLEEELEVICHFDPVDLFGKDGEPLRLHEMPPRARRALRGITVETKYEWLDDPLDPGRKKLREQVGTITRYQFPDKTSAIALGMKRRGGLREQVDVHVTTHAELVAEAARRAAAAKAGAKP